MNPAIAAMIRRSGRSWWQARYSDGKVLSEWDTLTTKLLLPFGKGRSSRWEDVPKDRMVGLRLLCPNGMAGELEAPEGHLFFQLKAGGFGVGMGAGARGPKSGRFTIAHVIGVVEDASGNCTCYAWEYPQKKDVLHRVCWKCGQVVTTEFCPCGQDLRGIAPADKARLRTFSKEKLVKPAGLVKFRDNITDIKYQNIGKLSLVVQQLRS